jgi:nitric oxide reductase large subunit
LTAAVTFAIGVFAFAKGIADSRILSRRLTWLVVGALVVMAVARLVPVGAVQFYVQGAAGIVALWPLAYEMWKRPEAARPAGQPRPMPAA